MMEDGRECREMQFREFQELIHYYRFQCY